MPLLFNEEIDAEKFSDSLRSCSSQSAGTGQTDAGGGTLQFVKPSPPHLIPEDSEAGSSKQNCS